MNRHKTALLSMIVLPLLVSAAFAQPAPAPGIGPPLPIDCHEHWDIHSPDGDTGFDFSATYIGNGTYMWVAVSGDPNVNYFEWGYVWGSVGKYSYYNEVKNVAGTLTWNGTGYDKNSSSPHPRALNPPGS